MSNQIDTIFEKIEDFKFNFDVNQASGFAMFKKLVYKHSNYVELLRGIKDLESNAFRVKARIMQLLFEPIDKNYENPYDVPIATYLMALENSLVEDVDLFAKEVFRSANLWWGHRIAQEIIFTKLQENENKAENQTINVPSNVSVKYKSSSLEVNEIKLTYVNIAGSPTVSQKVNTQSLELATASSEILQTTKESA